MPTWSGILDELARSREGGNPPQFDAVRRKYLAQLWAKTKREVILYATKWTQHDPNVSPELISIVDEDIQGIMEVIHGLKGPDLDLIVHSPGGSLEAVEALVTYLRSKFSNIRVIVPQMAMSAATMLACAADVVVLGKHSFLGPIDPQMIVTTPLGQRMVPMQAILEQFELAKKECTDPAKMGAWLPMLGQFGPDLLVQCQEASVMSRELVCNWLQEYMFKEKKDGKDRAEKIATWLADHRVFKSHGRHIPRAELQRMGLKVQPLESDQDLQDLVLSVFHATTHTFGATAAVKIIENHHGKAFIKQVQAVMMPMPPPQGALAQPMRQGGSPRKPSARKV
jgi:hypothetical protein